MLPIYSQRNLSLRKSWLILDHSGAKELATQNQWLSIQFTPMFSHPWPIVTQAEAGLELMELSQPLFLVEPVSFWITPVPVAQVNK